ncbi:YwbE family protein [Marinicella litoralis]|uniref:Putative repeat protein (TIGR03833 family) n=1 Tax=Marinicella litoralis TaxID=644220 RepID=A0A4R6XS88_9GAMM|nr:YwbE family protein [Marinicella litoralis]TDR22626.1 putative repeat protein (TIGR03833 family) [Marinicella litoralis]
MSGNKRSELSIGLEVSVVQKPHQRSGELTQGVIARILTNSPNHPHGIKVKLESGVVGRVKLIHD